jgi:hypothetical protein
MHGGTETNIDLKINVSQNSGKSFREKGPNKLNYKCNLTYERFIKCAPARARGRKKVVAYFVSPSKALASIR